MAVRRDGDVHLTEERVTEDGERQLQIVKDRVLPATCQREKEREERGRERA